MLKIAKEPISLETPIGDEEDSHLGDFIEDKNAVLPLDAAIQANLRETTTRVLASLTAREERVLRMRFGIGMNTDHTLGRGRPAILGDPRAHPPDRGQGPAQAEAPEPLAQTAQLPRYLRRPVPSTIGGSPAKAGTHRRSWSGEARQGPGLRRDPVRPAGP